jgi:hypothetical protein
MGSVVGWAHVRAAGRKGADSAEALEEFCSSETWHAETIEAARAAARRTRRDHAEFKEAWKSGRVRLPPPWPSD